MINPQIHNVKSSDYVMTGEDVWVFTGTDFVKINPPCCEEKSGNDREKTIGPIKGHQKRGITIDNLARLSAVRDLEKRVGRMEEDHISLVAYLSSFHGLDISEWNDWKNNTRTLPDKVYYDKHGEVHDLRHTDTRMYPDEKTFWEVEYEGLKTGA